MPSSADAEEIPLNPPFFKRGEAQTSVNVTLTGYDMFLSSVMTELDTWKAIAAIEHGTYRRYRLRAGGGAPPLKKGELEGDSLLTRTAEQPENPPSVPPFSKGGGEVTLVLETRLS